MAKKGTKAKKPAPAKDAPYEETAVVAGSNRCPNCGREHTLVTRVSCTDCGFTKPA